MQVPIDSAQLLEREFLEIRAKLLQLAASLDRIDRAEGSVASDPRIGQIQQALDVLKSARSNCDRAEQIQLLCSRQYEVDWQSNFDMPTAK